MDLRNWLRRVRIHMAKGTVTKVMKYELRYLSGFSDFHAMQQAVWGLQRQSREILNKTIQMAFHWDYISRENFNANGVYLDVKAETATSNSSACTRRVSRPRTSCRCRARSFR